MSKNNNNKTNSTNKPFVALTQHDSSSTTPTLPVLLTDPCTGTQRQYLTTTSTTTTNGIRPSSEAATAAPTRIYEVQSLPHTKSETYSSFFVNSRVISNPHMHLVTPVDPLFFILYFFEREEKWQPWDQLVTTKNIPSRILQALDVKQLEHLFLLNNSLGDDLILYKFDKVRTLAWLQRKMDRIFVFLDSQLDHAWNVQQKEIQKTLYQRGNQDDTGAFCNTFCLPPSSSDNRTNAAEVQKDRPVQVSPETDHPPTNVDKDGEINIKSSKDQMRIKHSAVQILCEYLPPFWQSEFLKSQGMAMEDLSMATSKKNKKGGNNVSDHMIDSSETITATWDSAVSKSSNIPSSTHNMSEIDKLHQYTMGSSDYGGEGSLSTSTSSKKRKETEQSAGLKKLSKVNTKGMKAMTSFFNVVAKPKNSDKAMKK